MKNRNSIALTAIVLGLTAAACAHVVPKELADARASFLRASTGPAKDLTPADLHKAKVALDRAELAFSDDPTAQTTRDLAYVAERRAQIAEVLALQTQDNRDKKRAEETLQTRQVSELASTKRELALGDRQHDRDAEKLAGERIARQDAEDRTAEALKQLAGLAAIKEEARGLVLTLSGGVLFVTNQAALLPTAQTKLDQIAEALISGGSRSILVEGHTDSNGGDEHNMELSLRRADAVRSYIIGRGYPTYQIRSSGLGKSRPIASNSSAEGRANNRRVEIVVLPKP